MAAPIQRYNDPRLYGASLVSPFNASYQWIRTAAHPWHSKCNPIVELAIRVFKVSTGVVFLAITAPLALVGRSIQILHYHILSQSYREHPDAIEVAGMRLPHLLLCEHKPTEVFHGTKEAAAISILRWGFDPNKTAETAVMGKGVYLSKNDAVSISYGENQLSVTVDVKSNEIARLSPESLREFLSGYRKTLLNEQVRADVHKLFYMNGYRAIRYDLRHYGTEEAWVIIDPSCLKITKITQSPAPNAPLCAVWG